MNKLSVLMLAATLSACSDSTGPKDANISGSWTYNVSNLSGAGLSCNAGGTTVTISQSGSTFTGSYSGGTLSCGSFGSVDVGSGTVANGTVTNNAVTFNFDTPDWTNSGSVSGNSISGTATLRLVLTGGQTVIMTGNFSMVKK